MIIDVCQRHRDGRASYRPAREVIDPRQFEVAAIDDDTTPKAFVCGHHYSHSYVAARHRFGLYQHSALVGVAVFSQPVNDLALACLPGERKASVELGRLVLLDHVLANAESWFVARCFELLRREGLTGIISFSDPVARTDAAGEVVFPGHLGHVYQATNAAYLGRATARTLRVLPDGSTFNDRTAQKIRSKERGWEYAAELLVHHGAEAPSDTFDLTSWLRRALAQVTRPLPHAGNHKYAWLLGARDHVRYRKEHPLAYPKVLVPQLDLFGRGAA